MSKFKINKNIPIPAIGNIGRKRGSKYPFANMECGDSFFLKGKTLKTTSYFINMAKHFGIKLSRRQVEENGENGLRIWRTK